LWFDIISFFQKPDISRLKSKLKQAIEIYAAGRLKAHRFQQSYLYQIKCLYIKKNLWIVRWLLFRAGFLF
jgi:hypothetical protein